MAKPTLHGILVLGILATSPCGARAGEEERAALCRDDVMRLCLTSIPDRGRIVACMRAQQANLSPGCKAVFDGGGQGADAQRTSTRH